MATQNTSSNGKQRAKILVVDDDHDVAITLKAILEGEEEGCVKLRILPTSHQELANVYFRL